jgi:hypothetical protein
VKMYRLLVAFPEQGAEFSRALDEALADRELRQTSSALVGVACGGYVRLRDGDFRAAPDLIHRELRAAEDLSNLGQ